MNCSHCCRSGCNWIGCGCIAGTNYILTVSDIHFSKINWLSRKTLDLSAHSQDFKVNLLLIYYFCGKSFDMPVKSLWARKPKSNTAILYHGHSSIDRAWQKLNTKPKRRRFLIPHTGDIGTLLFLCPLLRSRGKKALDISGFAGAFFIG